MNTSHSVITATLCQPPVDVSTQSDSDALRPQPLADVDSDDVTSEIRTLDVDPPQSVACLLEPPSVASADVESLVDVRTDHQHIRDDEADTRLDETVYHDCISTSFTSKLLFFSAEVEVWGHVLETS